jgi:hypothetical protein
MDIPSIGDRNLLALCRSYADLCRTHNALTERVFKAVGDYLGETVGGHSTSGTWSSNGWGNIKGEILTRLPSRPIKSNVVHYVRQSTKQPWVELRESTDDALYLRLYEDLHDRFRSDLEDVITSDESLLVQLDELTRELERAVSRTYPIS